MRRKEWRGGGGFWWLCCDRLVLQNPSQEAGLSLAVILRTSGISTCQDEEKVGPTPGERGRSGLVVTALSLAASFPVLDRQPLVAPRSQRQGWAVSQHGHEEEYRSTQHQHPALRAVLGMVLSCVVMYSLPPTRTSGKLLLLLFYCSSKQSKQARHQLSQFHCAVNWAFQNRGCGMGMPMS